MKQTPYSLSEARERCNAFRHLCGCPYSADVTATVDCVAVAPFDQNNKNRFIMYYLLFEDADIALEQDYYGLLFDVIVIAGAKDGDEMLHESLDTWLAKQNSPALAPAIHSTAPVLVVA